MDLFQSLKNKNPDNPEKPNEATGFEIEDKPTPLAGKILLFIMAALLLFLGWRGLDDVYNIPSPPEPISTCAQSYVKIDYKITSRSRSTLYRRSPGTTQNIYGKTCDFSSLEVKHNIPELYSNLTNAKSQHDSLQKQISSTQTTLNKIKRDLSNKQRDYDLSLQESIAKKDQTAYDPNALQSQISLLESQITSLEQLIASLKSQSLMEQTRFQPQELALKEAGKQVSKDYNRTWAFYRLSVFLLQLFFSLPIFLISLKLYFKQKAKDSPYTLIFTALVGVTGILFARVAMTYIWNLFLADILTAIWKIIQNFPLLRTLMFYFGMFLTVLVFGGAVYLIQKKVFAPQRVYKRRVKKGKCPYCETSLKLSKSHCPECGKQIRETCNSCKKLRFKVMPHCPHCGSK